MYYAQNVATRRVYAYTTRAARDAAVFGNVEPLTCINKHDARETMRRYILNRFVLTPCVVYVQVFEKLEGMNEFGVFQWYEEMWG